MNIGQIIVPAFILFVLGFIGFMGVKDYHKQTYAHDHYQPVDATITTSKLVYPKSANTKSGSIRAEIGYTYAVNGNTYKGWRYAYISPDEEPHQRVARFPLGAHVMAYVDPDNPADAILYNFVTPAPQIVMWFIPAPLFMIACYVITRRISRRIQAKKNGTA